MRMTDNSTGQIPPRSGTTTCTTKPANALTYVRAGALVPPPPYLGGGATRVGPSQNPKCTRTDFGQEAVGCQSHRDHRAPQMSQAVSSTHSTRLTSRAWLRSHVCEALTNCERKCCVLRDTLSSSLPLLPRKCAVVSAFKNFVSWLKSLCQGKETGVARQRE